MSENLSSFPDEAGVAALFDGMAEEYDAITDLWYSWLFCRLHYLLVRYLHDQHLSPGLKCLDVGCGTGFQSLLLNLCGHHSVGVDVAAELVARARRKQATDLLQADLFPARFGFAKRYSKEIRNLADSCRGQAPLGRSDFQVGSATHLDFPDQSFDLVNCCGSTLSFVSDYAQAIREMARVLRPGGHLIIEVENRYNPDLFWTCLDATIFFGQLGYGENAKTAFANVTRSGREHVRVDYPFSSSTGEITMPLWLFSSLALQRQLAAAGFRVDKTYGIHAITNLIPSTFLDRANPSRLLQTIFVGLGKLEERAGGAFRRYGCSLLIVGRKI